MNVRGLQNDSGICMKLPVRKIRGLNSNDVFVQVNREREHTVLPLVDLAQLGNLTKEGNEGCVQVCRHESGKRL